MKRSLLTLAILGILSGAVVLLFDPGFGRPEIGPAPPWAASEDPDSREATPSPEEPVKTRPTRIELEVASLVRQLGDEDPDRRDWAVYRLRQIGPDARVAVPLLKRFVETDSTEARWTAMAAVMEMEPSRVYYRELAEEAVVRWRSTYHVFRDFDPANAGAIHEAIHHRNESKDGEEFPAGVSRFLESFYESVEGGAAVLAMLLPKASEDELEAWLGILGQMDPVPAAVGPALGKILSRDGDDARVMVLQFLEADGVDVRALRGALVPVLHRLLGKLDANGSPLLLAALGNLGAADAETLRALRAGLLAGGPTARQAARAIERLGPAARECVEDLIRVAAERPVDERFPFLSALLATKDRRAVPFLASAVRGGDREEFLEIAERGHEVEGAADLAPALLERFDEVEDRDLKTLVVAAVRCDPEFVRSETEKVVIRALDDARPPSRRYALSAFHYAKSVTPEVATSLARAVVDVVDDENIPPIGTAVAALGRIGKEAAPLVPALLKLAEERAVQHLALEAVVRIRPDARGGLETFRRYALDGFTYTARYWCVVGIGRVSKPNSTDRALLERVAGDETDRHLKPGEEARRILSLPGWK